MHPMALFVSLVYTRYWHEAPIAIRAQKNDFELGCLLLKYPDKGIENVAYRALIYHLCYIYEDLIFLTLSDEMVDDNEKGRMIDNLLKCDLEKNLNGYKEKGWS
ncbi:UNVERIFIED_CONTAM: hypothetical protein RMT77_014520 [Armadillidium vulgare]